MNIVIEPSSLKGEITAIPSKSVAHRMLICAALADGPTTLRIPKTSDDIDATADCLRALGAAITVNNEDYIVEPIAQIENIPLLDCGESGSTLRFLLPVAAAAADRCRFDGHGRLPERPLSDLTDAMKEHGVSFDGEKLPFTIGGRLRGGIYRLPGNVSSQYITGLLLALPLCEEDSVIELTTALESASYIDITLSVLKTFGITVHCERNRYIIPGKQVFRSPGTLPVEGDWSNAAFFLTAAALNNDITMTGLNPNSAQGDRKIIALLEQLGAVTQKDNGRLTLRSDELKGCTIDIQDTPDLLPVLSVAAAFAQGKTTFINAARLRLKESDRLASSAAMIENLGGRAEVGEDELTVYGTGLIGGTVESCNDHRIAMSAAVAATRCSKPVTILNAEAVKKSYPGFYNDYNKTGGKAHVL